MKDLLVPKLELPTDVAMTQRQRYYYPQLDGLRFLAAVLVILYHCGNVPPFLSWTKTVGWAGVDLFLVLSAYLLTHLMRIEVESRGGTSLRKYFLRRVLRIWPLYFGFITASFVYSLAIEQPGSLQLGVFLSHLTFVNNALVGVLGWDISLPYTNHLWTITLEEQFYVILPFVVPILMKSSLPNKTLLAATLLGLLFLACGRAVFALSYVPMPFIYTSLLRGDSFLLGVMLALGAFSGISKRLNGDIMFGGGVFILFASGLFFGQPSMRLAWQVLAYPFIDIGCLLIVLGCISGATVNRFLKSNAMCYLGKVSFGIYVFHVLSIDLSDNLALNFGQYASLLSAPISIIISIALAVISYELFEKRILKLKSRFEVVDSRPA